MKGVLFDLPHSPPPPPHPLREKITLRRFNLIKVKKVDTFLVHDNANFLHFLHLKLLKE